MPPVILSLCDIDGNLFAFTRNSIRHFRYRGVRLPVSTIFTKYFTLQSSFYPRPNLYGVGASQNYFRFFAPRQFFTFHQTRWYIAIAVRSQHLTCESVITDKVAPCRGKAGIVIKINVLLKRFCQQTNAQSYFPDKPRSQYRAIGAPRVHTRFPLVSERRTVNPPGVTGSSPFLRVVVFRFCFGTSSRRVRRRIKNKKLSLPG